MSFPDRRPRPRRRGGPHPGAARAQRRGQVHGPRLHRRTAAPDVRTDHPRRPDPVLPQRLQRRATLGAAARARRRPARPGSPPLPPPVGARQRGLRPTQRRYAAWPGPRRWPASGWRRSMPRSSPTGDRRRSPAARPSGSPSPARSPPSPTCCCSTSRCPPSTSTPRPAIRQLLRRVLEGRTTILVTHDILDAVLLADDVAVLEDGRVVEQGPTARVLTRPTSRLRRAHRRPQPGARNGPRHHGLHAGGPADRGAVRGRPGATARRPSRCSARAPWASTACPLGQPAQRRARDGDRAGTARAPGAGAHGIPLGGHHPGGAGRPRAAPGDEVVSPSRRAKWPSTPREGRRPGDPRRHRPSDPRY